MASPALKSQNATEAKAPKSCEQIFMHSIKRVIVMDVDSQLTIFEYKKKWSGSDETDGVDALIKTFYQFAHSTNKNSGALQKVRFEKPRVTRKHNRKTTRQTQNEMLVKSIMKPLETMEMIVKDHEGVRAILFIDITSWDAEIEPEIRQRVDKYLNDLTTRFRDQYKTVIDADEFRSNIKEIADDISRNKADGPKSQLKMMETFKDFDIKALLGDQSTRESHTTEKGEESNNVPAQGTQNGKSNSSSSPSGAIDEDKKVESTINTEYNDSQNALALSDVTLTAKDGAAD